jgi:hypothetical protein
LLVLASLFSFSQSKFKAGVYAEGGYFFPQNSSSVVTLENNLATGIGVFSAYDINQKLSVSLGAGYRFKPNNTKSLDYGYNPYGYSGSGYGGVAEREEYTFRQHYFVLPLKLRFLLSKKLFAEAGITSAWILNQGDENVIQLSETPDGYYNASINEKQEFDWNIGLGYKLTPKLNVALSYTQGIKEQGISYITNTTNLNSHIYKNRMLMLNVSYTISD